MLHSFSLSYRNCNSVGCLSSCVVKLLHKEFTQEHTTCIYISQIKDGFFTCIKRYSVITIVQDQEFSFPEFSPNNPMSHPQMFTRGSQPGRLERYRSSCHLGIFVSGRNPIDFRGDGGAWRLGTSFLYYFISIDIQSFSNSF